MLNNYIQFSNIKKDFANIILIKSLNANMVNIAVLLMIIETYRLT